MKKFKNYIITQASWDNIGERIHTALRKLCDSPITSIAYIAIGNMKDEDWQSYTGYLKMCNSTLHSFCPKESLYIHIQAWSLGWSYQRTTFPMILNNAFKLFSIDDWKRYCRFITVKIRKEEK